MIARIPMTQPLSRRDLLTRVALGSLGPAVARAQRGATAGAQTPDSSITSDTTNLFVMDQSAAKSVTLPPKPGAAPLLTGDQRDELERRIGCQCGCTLDVFTCRTTDFSCQVSPAMHRDVMGLVKGGYSAEEIIDAFVNSYGERVRMAPRKTGFNLLLWLAPGTVVIVGGVVVALMLKSWTKPDSVGGSNAAPSLATSFGATPDELARLDAAVKGSDDDHR